MLFEGAISHGQLLVLQAGKPDAATCAETGPVDRTCGSCRHWSPGSPVPEGC